MSTHHSWSRRSFVQQLAAATTLPAFWSALPAQTVAPLLTPELFAGLDLDPITLRQYAEAYLDGSVPDSRQIELGIFGAELQNRDAESLRSSLDRRIRTDFEVGATARVQGWVLSRTEIQVWVLVDLLRPQLQK